MKKRGLSTVVTTIIMVLLVLVAIGVVWVVIRNIITDTSEQITTETILIDLKVTGVVNNSVSGSLDVSIERLVGEGDLTGMKVIVSNGTSSEVFPITTPLPKELESNIYTIPGITLVNIIGVSVSSVVTSPSGDDKLGIAGGFYTVSPAITP